MVHFALYQEMETSLNLLQITAIAIQTKDTEKTVDSASCNFTFFLF
jgi:hypothetical protein